jgi:transcriptional regulator GlxA family with amidase domain
MFAFDGAQTLDVTGPLEVFAVANRFELAEGRSGPPPYRLEVLAPTARAVTTSSQLRLLPDRAYAGVRGGIDTLIIAGGDVRALRADSRLLRWLRTMAQHTRRLASVCTGAFLLAEAGLLDGRRATTHWAWATRLAARHPSIDVDPDAIYVRDGSIYTSAGVTAGIDLALALIEEDLGHARALAVARQLVVFLKRPGGQSQFSSHLAAQSTAQGPLKDVPEWILANLQADLSVERLAERAAMSPRNFARVFRREAGVTPAKFVELARIEAARRRLEETQHGVEEIAAACGFASGEQMRRTFQRHLHVVPNDYRRRFHHQPPALVRASA